MIKPKSQLAALVICLVLASVGISQNSNPGGTSTSAALSTYKTVPGISGDLSSVGSDTLNELMSYWVEGFKKLYPSVRVQVEGKGSATAPPALIKGTAQLGPMSREMKAEELDSFEKAFGYKPTAFKVAIDALAIYVHKDCPLEKLTMAQADAIFSKGRKAGLEKTIDTWADLGVTGEWATRPISLYGRNSASGTYGYFKEHVLMKGDFKDTVKEQPGSATVVQGIAADKFGMGYSGIGYRTSDVKPLALAAKPDKPFVTTESENVYAGKYPLARFLYVYVNKAPNKPLDPVTLEFLRFVLSAQGQELVTKGGYLPLRPSDVEPMMKGLSVGSR